MNATFRSVGLIIVKKSKYLFFQHNLMTIFHIFKKKRTFWDKMAIPGKEGEKESSLRKEEGGLVTRDV